jgi:hypothetical protein
MLRPSGAIVQKRTSVRQTFRIGPLAQQTLDVPSLYVTLHEVAADLGGATRTHCGGNSNPLFSRPEVRSHNRKRFRS